MWLNPVNQFILMGVGCLLAAIAIVRVFQWLQRRGQRERESVSRH